MDIRIAVFGSSGFMKELLEVPVNKDIDITTFIYKNPNESPELVRKVNGFDVLLFTGPVPYYLSLQEIKKKNLPAIFIPFDEYVLSLTLHYVRHDQNVLSNRLSFDIHEQKIIYNVFADMNIDTSFIYIKDYKDLIESNPIKFNEELIQFHFDLWEAGKIDLAITSINSVFERLKKLNVRCIRMVMPQKNIIDTLNNGYTRGELIVSKKSQIAVGFISIKEYKNLINERGKSAEQEVILKLHQILLDFAKEINATLHYLSNEQYLLFGTRGPIEYVTKKEEYLNVLKRITEDLNIHVGIGFGFGIDAIEAEENAKIAHSYALESKEESSGFIVTDSKLVVGPFNHRSKKFHFRSEDVNLLALANKSGLSVANISKIIRFWELRSNKGFTANELAVYLEFSRRSSERILKKLLENGLAIVVGEEQPYSKGRPRSVYKLKL